ncbi:MAG TPA: carbohydrate binding domain-containing protein [Candidatus Eisenbacteria bacterium]|nr:carbohydrate binding domain-containing protein [Candidatus Eisenbacteria bacterium]
MQRKHHIKAHKKGHRRKKIKLLFLILGILVVVAGLSIVLIKKSNANYPYGYPRQTAFDILRKSLDAYSTTNLYIDPQNPYPNLAFEASAMFQGAKVFEQIDPVSAQRYKDLGITIANYLVTHKDDNADGKVGWGLAYAWDAFGDSTPSNPSINPANTVYAFQTGLVGKALVDAYIATNDSTYLTTAQQAVADYLPSSTTTVDSQCTSCRMFWYSTSVYDAGRYVKNSNMMMGLFIGKLATVPTVGPQYTPLAQELLNEQVYEVNTRNNFAYLGYNDPHFSPFKDSHLATEIFGFKDLINDLQVATLSSNKSALENMTNTFWGCGDTCQAKLPSEFALFIGCYTAKDLLLSDLVCEKGISQNDPQSTSTPISSYDDVGMIQFLNDNVLQADPPYSTPNILTNGSFENNETNWTYAQSGTANANPHGTDCTDGNATDGNCSLRVNVTNTGANWWSIKEEQMGVNLYAGTDYALQFDAKSDTPGRQVTIEIGPNGAYGTVTKTLTNSWQRFIYTFTPNSTNTNSPLDIYFARQTGNVWVDGVVIQPIGGVPTPTPTPPLVNFLQNPSFESGETNWTYAQTGSASASPHGTDCNTGNTTDGNCSLRVKVLNTGANWWSIKEEQTAINLNAGTNYTLKFDAKTDSPNRQITMEIGPNGAYGATTKTLSSSWQTFTYSFTPNATSSAALDMYFARQTGTVWVDKLSITAN